VGIDGAVEVGEVCISDGGWRAVLDDAEGVDYSVRLLSGKDRVVAVIEHVDVAWQRT